MPERDAAILGAGSWGTALAIHLARCGRRVSLWAHDADRGAEMEADRENRRYLPGHRLPDGIAVTGDMAAALEGARSVLLVVPSHHVRGVLAQARRCWPAGAPICSASKGIESDSLLRMSQVCGQALGPVPVAVLSGPSFAREVAEGHPTAVVVAAADAALAERLQELVSGGNVRAYTNLDLIGVELGGALKNVMAIGAGAAEGLGYGTNTLAALITRGLAEMSRLAEAVGLLVV
jgi:glycerol-3-phosphate dehydrogenase (NAD(P)+)